MKKFTWKTLVDGESEISADPINQLGEAVTENRNFLNELPTDFELQKNKNVAGGYAGLDNNGKIFEQNLPEKIVFADDDGKIKEEQIPNSIARKTDIPAPVDISGKEDKANKGIAGGYASLDNNGKVPTSQLPDNIGGGGSDLSIMIPSDIEYEVVEGKVVAFGGKSIKDNADCFTVFIKIPEKKFAAIYATARNAKDGTYDSWLAVCDSNKNPIGNVNNQWNKAGQTNTGNLSVIGANYINDYENPCYWALSYTNGTAFEVGLFGADVVDKSYLPISETDLPKNFIVDGDNLVTGLYNVRWSTNGYWQYHAISSTNTFEVVSGDVLYANSKFLNINFFDENYTYVGTGTTGVNATPVAVSIEGAKYACALFTSGYEVNDLWVAKTDISRKKYKPDRIVNPKYIDLDDIDKKQLNSWYNGKRISFIGDSLTGTGTGSFYISYLDAFFGFGTKTNCGVGGTCVCGSGTKAFWYDERVNAVDINSDIIFIAGGTNDANNNKTIGEASISNCDTETFIGAYNVLISKLLYKFYKLDSGYYSSIDYSGVTQVETVKPVKIFLVTPPYMLDNETQYNKTPAFAEAVIEIGKLTGYPVCDTRANSGVNIMLAEYYKTLENDGTGDYVHLNTEAHKHWAEVMIGKMLEVEPIE